MKYIFIYIIVIILISCNIREPQRKLIDSYMQNLIGFKDTTLTKRFYQSISKNEVDTQYLAKYSKSLTLLKEKEIDSIQNKYNGFCTANLYTECNLEFSTKKIIYYGINLKYSIKKSNGVKYGRLINYEKIEQMKKDTFLIKGFSVCPKEDDIGLYYIIEIRYN